MTNGRKTAHATYDIKYRKTVITGKIAERTGELIRQICQGNDVEIQAGHVGKDHIYLLVSVPPHLSASTALRK